MALENINFKEFRYNKNMEYHNNPPTNVIRFKKAIKKESGPGSLCPSCGLTRSRMNKCECNS
jgi:hypothetical protein